MILDVFTFVSWKRVAKHIFCAILNSQTHSKSKCNPSFYFVSLWSVYFQSLGQYFITSILSGCFCLFLVVAYFLSWHSIHANVTLTLMSTSSFPDFTLSNVYFSTPPASVDRFLIYNLSSLFEQISMIMTDNPAAFMQPDWGGILWQAD